MGHLTYSITIKFRKGRKTNILIYLSHGAKGGLQVAATELGPDMSHWGIRKPKSLDSTK